MFDAVHRLTKDSWAFEPWHTATYCLGSAFCTVCRYGITFLDASILTLCVSGMQSPQSVDSYSFMMIIFKRLALSGIYMGVDWLLDRVLERADWNIRQVRMQRTIAAF